MPPGSELLALQEAVAGRYAVEREPGRGGMGVVFLARDLALDRLVDIKLLPPALAASADRRARCLSLMRFGVGLGMISLAGVRRVTAFHAIRDAIRRGYGYEDIRAALLGTDEEREPVSIGAKVTAAAGWLGAFGTAGLAWFWVGTAGNQWHGLVQVAADLAVIFLPLSAGG
jgi:hypothetical protein